MGDEKNQLPKKRNSICRWGQVLVMQELLHEHCRKAHKSELEKKQTMMLGGKKLP